MAAEAALDGLARQMAIDQLVPAGDAHAAAPARGFCSTFSSNAARSSRIRSRSSIFAALAIAHVENVERLIGVGRNAREMNPQAEPEQRVRDREQQADAVLREHVDDGELLGGAIVDGDFGRHVAHELAAGALHVMRRGDQRRDVLLAGDDALEVVLDAQPAVVFQRHRGLAHLMRHAKHVHRDTVGARGDSGRQDVEIVGGQRARDHREQSRPIARHDDELAELQLGEMADAADQRAVVERAHQIEVQRDVVFGHGEEVAVRHLVQESVDVGFRSRRARAVSRARRP